MQNGKGSKPRPLSNYANYVSNWDEIAWDSKEEEHKDSNETVEEQQTQEGD